MKKIIIFSILAFGLVAAPAMAGITFVNSDSAYELVTVIGTPTTLMVSGFDAGTAADTYVIVAVATKQYDDVINIVNSVTFGGTALTKIAEEYVSDGVWKGWAVLYGAALSGTGDVVMNYTAPTLDTTYNSEGVGFCVASYSDVSGVDAISSGANTGSGTTIFSDTAIITTNDNSLVISSLMLGSGATTVTGLGSTVMRESAGVTDEKVNSTLLELIAPTAGSYTPGASYPSQSRVAIISAELVEQAAPKATTFIIR